MASNIPAKAHEPIKERRVYHGKVSDDDFNDFIVEGHIGYSRIVTVKVEAGSMELQFSMCPAKARELASHLNEAADSAVAAKGP